MGELEPLTLTSLSQLEGATVSLKELAPLLNLGERRCAQLAKDGVLHRVEKGRYLLLKSIAGYNRYSQSARGSGTGTATGNVTEEKARLTKLQADRVDHELRVVQGEYVPVADVVKEWNDMLAVVKTKVLAQPAKLAPIIAVESDMRACQVILEEANHEALNELHSYDAEDSEGTADAGGAETARAANG